MFNLISPFFTLLNPIPSSPERASCRAASLGHRRDKTNRLDQYPNASLTLRVGLLNAHDPSPRRCRTGHLARLGGASSVGRLPRPWYRQASTARRLCHGICSSERKSNTSITRHRSSCWMVGWWSGSRNREQCRRGSLHQDGGPIPVPTTLGHAQPGYECFDDLI